MKKSVQFWLRVILILLVVCLVFYLLPLMAPFIISLILTILLWPLVSIIKNLVEKHMGIVSLPRWIAIVPAMLIFSIALIIIIKYVLIPFAAEFVKFSNNVPNFTDQFIQVVHFIQNNYLNQNVPVKLVDLINTTIVRIGNYSVVLAQKALQAVVSFAGFLVQLLLVPVITFYLLKDGQRISETCIGLFEGETRKRVQLVSMQIYRMLSGYILGELLLAVNMFWIVLLVLSLLGVPYPLVLALLAAIAEWIPIVGPFLGAIPAIVLAAIISIPLAIKVAVFYVIIQIIDGQITMPKVFGRIIKLHPIVIIGSVFIGGTLYGIKGMMLAVPMTAIASIIASHLWYFDRLKGDRSHHERSK